MLVFVCLKTIKKSFFICSIVKLAKNDYFIYKKFYVQNLIKELGFDETILNCFGNDTYKPCSEDKSNYTNIISDTLLNRYNVNMCHAAFFGTPSFKARFIAGAKKSVTKPLNILVNSHLKLLRECFKKYCEAIYNNSGIHFFWSIDSSLQFLNTPNNNDVYNLQVYDFTTLYTRLDLLEV